MRTIETAKRRYIQRVRYAKEKEKYAEGMSKFLCDGWWKPCFNTMIEGKNIWVKFYKGHITKEELKRVESEKLSAGWPVYKYDTYDEVKASERWIRNLRKAFIP